MSTGRTLLIALALAACGKDDPAARPRGPAEPGGARPEAGPSPSQLGSCTVEITGAITAAQTSGGGTTKSVTSYWFAPGDESNLVFARGKTGLVLNCTGEALSLNLVAKHASADAVPFGPKTYKLRPRRSALTALAMVGKTSITNLTGTVDVTAFDRRHIAGTFELAGKTLPGNKDVGVTGAFDFACPGFSGCAR